MAKAPDRPGKHGRALICVQILGQSLAKSLVLHEAESGSLRRSSSALYQGGNHSEWMISTKCKIVQDMIALTKQLKGS